MDDSNEGSMLVHMSAEIGRVLQLTISEREREREIKKLEAPPLSTHCGIFLMVQGAKKRPVRQVTHVSTSKLHKTLTQTPDPPPPNKQLNQP